MTRLIPARLLMVGKVLVVLCAATMVTLVAAACGSSSASQTTGSAVAASSVPAAKSSTVSAGTVDKTKTRSPAPAASPTAPASSAVAGANPCTVLPSSTFGALLGTTVGSTRVDGQTCWIEPASNASLYKASVTYQPVQQQIVTVLETTSQKVAPGVYTTQPGFIYLTFLPNGMEVGVSLGLDASCNPTQDEHKCVRGDPQAAIRALAALN